VHVKGRWRYDASYPPLVDAKNRRSLTPSTGLPVGEDDVHATRRGAARHDVSSRVTLKAKSGALLEGWALNVSRGGVRVILEEKVKLGSEFEVTLSTGEDSAAPLIGRVVWVQEEPDGVVAGIEFR
jgi:PilZ domain